MNPWKNERGAALILVLFLVVLVSLLCAPLLLSTSQGLVQSTGGQNSEKAYYIAESGALIAKRALYEAVAHERISLNAAKIQEFVNRLDGADLDMYGGTVALSPVFSVMAPDASAKLGIQSQGSVSEKSVAKSRSVVIRLKVTEGGAGESEYTKPGGIFGVDAVTPDIRQNLYMRPNGDNITTNLAIPKADFDKQFDAYFDSQFALRPKAKNPPAALVPPDVKTSAAGDTLTVSDSVPAKTYTLANTSGAPVTTSVNGPLLSRKPLVIEGGYGQLVLDGDVVSGGDIDIHCSGCSITIRGSLIAAGKITVRGDIQRLDIAGSTTAGGPIAFSGSLDEFNVGGHLRSKSSMAFSSSIGGFRVGGSMLSGPAASGSPGISFGTVHKVLTVGGDLSSQGQIDFTTTLGAQGALNRVGRSIVADQGLAFNYFSQLEVGGDIASGGAIDFKNRWDALKVAGSLTAGRKLNFANVVVNTTIGGSITSKEQVSFVGPINGLTLTAGDGSIVSGGGISFGSSVTGLSMSGSIGGEGDVRFTNTIESASVGGSLYAGGMLGLGNSVKGLELGSSIFANQISIDNTVDRMNVKGTMLSKGSIYFSTGVNNLTVGSYLGTKGTINFRYATQSKPHLGGITAGGSVSMESWQADKSVIIERKPPPNVQGEAPPTIEFGDWMSQ